MRRYLSLALTRLVSLLAAVERYIEYRRQQRALLSLSDHMLKDIGVSRSEADYYSRLPFAWRPRRTASQDERRLNQSPEA